MNKSLILILILNYIFQGNIFSHAPENKPEPTREVSTSKMESKTINGEHTDYYFALPDTIPSPWSDICLTCTEAKVLSTVVTPGVSSFPWIPIIGVVVAAGVVTYVVSQDDNDPTDCTFTPSAQISPSTCELPNGAISISVTPADEYQFIWSNGSTSNIIQNVATGTYSVTITRTGTDCDQILSLTITNTNPSFNATIITQDSECGQQNGSAIVNVDPADSYTYSWSNGGSTSATQDNMPPGNYFVVVSLGGACTDDYPVNIGELPPNFEISVNTTPTACGESDGIVDITVIPEDAYNYAWSNGSTGSHVTGLAAGEYMITVSIPGTQCSKTISAIVEELPPNFEITITTTPSDCGQSNGTGHINVNPPGEYDYAWSNGSTGAEVSGLAAGQYNVTVTIPGTNCSKTIMTDVEELPPNFDITINTTPSDCGQSNGTGNINVSPAGTYSYSWSNGNTEAQAINLSPGVHQVTVTLAGTACSMDTSVTIAELPPTFIISSTTSPSGCTDSTGTATITVDPPGEYTYIWPNGITGPQVNSLAAGDYTVTVTISGTMCSNTTVVTVGQTSVEFTGTFSTDTASCGIADGSATITIDPPAEYTYVWSNQQTSPVAQQLTTGNYSVTVTDMQGCSSSFSTFVSEDPAEYISIVNTIPGNCTGGGEITFTLTTPGTGPLILEVVGPSGSESFTFVQGTYLLSTLMNVPAGNYTLTVYDQVIGPVCTEMDSATVMNNTPILEALDDFYNTPGGETLSGNAIDNDSGLNLEMIMISNIFGGTVVFDTSGTFTFTPEPGFNGDASFTYTVIDACGLTDTAIVTIFVEEVICEFTLDVTTTPASCGFSDGNIFVDVIEPGSYSYVWDTGDAGPVLNNVAAGTYTVTVEDLNLGCSLDFTISLSENPAEYIEDVVVTQPTCSTPGEISFVVSSPGSGQLTMVVDHPNGIDAFNIDQGAVFLSDYVSLVTGQYTIEVTDPVAGDACFESFTVDMIQPLSIEIVVEAVIPPSTPTGMDGAIVVVVTVPGEVPYTILLNGIPVSTTTQNNFIIEGLGAGNYTVQIFDATGCLSNILEVDVPFPDIILSFGSGVIHTGPYTTIPEQSLTDPFSQWNSCLITSLQFFISDKSQEVRFLYATPTQKKNLKARQPNFLTLDYLSEITRKEWKKISVKFQGGFGINYIPRTHSSLLTEPQHWILRGNLNRKIGKHLNLQSSASLTGWKKIEPPVIDFSLTILFPRTIRKPILVD